MVGLAAGLIFQAGYTQMYVGGLLDAREPWSLRALLAGQTFALLVGLLGFGSSALYNINPPQGDHEYGPLAVGMLIAFHAAVALWIFASRERQERIQISQL